MGWFGSNYRGPWKTPKNGEEKQVRKDWKGRNETTREKKKIKHIAGTIQQRELRVKKKKKKKEL